MVHNGENQPLPEYSSPFKQEKTTAKELDVNASHIVDGIIWSEILGPPRVQKSLSEKETSS